MAEVFISYERSGERQAVAIEKALREAGYDVWRDRQLPPHRTYAEVIEEQLRSATAVIVLWSAEASRSHWVRSEADVARQLGTLVQSTIDGAPLRMPFDQIQCVDLKDWNGDSNHFGWSKLVASIATLAGGIPPHSESERGLRSRSPVSICVLPFANMSGDIEQEYFSDGISEDITTDLSKVSALEVIARNTAFMFKGQSVDLTDVARKLNVSHVLEGSVRKSGNRVRITAQLIDGTTGSHVWADRYDRDFTDIFAIQDEISQAIVDALKIRLLPNEKKEIERRGTTNADAYNLYLRARQSWVTEAGNQHTLDRVVRLCERALQVDSEYAQAWALLGVVQANLYYSGNGSIDGLSAAERALSIDPTIAEAYLPLAWHLAMRGEEQQAQIQLEKALRLNPNCYEANKEAGRIFYRQGKLENAIPLLEKATDLDRSDFLSLGILTAAYLAKGELNRVRNCAGKLILLVEDAIARDPENGVAVALIALSHASLGQLGKARECLERARMLDPDNPYMWFMLTWTSMGFLNDPELTLELLEPALAQGGRALLRLVTAERNLNELRCDPRFQRMLDDAKARVDLEAVIPSTNIT